MSATTTTEASRDGHQYETQAQGAALHRRPWFPVFNGFFWDISIKPVAYAQSIASVHYNVNVDNDARADAHLIAAAPDMLANHKENARILRFLVNELQGRIDGGKLAAISGCLDRSDAAIARAEGRS